MFVRYCKHHNVFGDSAIATKMTAFAKMHDSFVDNYNWRTD